MKSQPQHPPPPDISGSEAPAEGVVLLADDGRKHVFDNPANVKRLIRGFMVVCGLLLAVDLLFLPPIGIWHKHLSFGNGALPAEGWFGFYCIYGLGACVMLVLLAKVLRKIIMRGEDYYDR
jgi:hypothetical protein